MKFHQMHFISYSKKFTDLNVGLVNTHKAALSVNSGGAELFIF